MNDKIKINLQIADSNYPLTINREEEQTVREAAKQVNIRLNKYREVYKNLEPWSPQPCRCRWASARSGRG